jgi:hypothetical protein
MIVLGQPAIHYQVDLTDAPEQVYLIVNGNNNKSLRRPVR